tara:strand:- start:100 stop:1128 length:1029 start_codon:yes stop_codon:yes gene_type:complete
MKIVSQSASDIAVLTDGRLEGDGNRNVNSLGKIELPSTNSLCFLANPKYEKYLYSGYSRTILVEEGFTPSQKSDNTLIYVDDVYGKFSELLDKYSKSKEEFHFVDELSSVDDSAKIALNVGVGKFSVVSKGVTIGAKTSIKDQVFIGEDVMIGENVVIHPGVRVLSNSIIGNNVAIHSNAVIGCDGFGFSPKGNEYHKIPQIGNVVIEDNVEIGSGTTIDRATLGSTIIRRGVKLDNLIQIGHNVIIGKNAVIAAQSGVAGSSEIGEGSMLGGQVGISGHIKIAPYSQIQAKSGVASSIKEKGKKWYGYPTISYTSYLKSYAIFKRLPQILKRISDLEKRDK